MDASIITAIVAMKNRFMCFSLAETHRQSRCHALAQGRAQIAGHNDPRSSLRTTRGAAKRLSGRSVFLKAVAAAVFRVAADLEAVVPAAAGLADDRRADLRAGRHAVVRHSRHDDRRHYGDHPDSDAPSAFPD